MRITLYFSNKSHIKNAKHVHQRGFETDNITLKRK